MLRIVRYMPDSVKLKYITLYLNRRMYKIRFKTQFTYIRHYIRFIDQFIYNILTGELKTISEKEYQRLMKNELYTVNN
jgi:hypothetical protein